MGVGGYVKQGAMMAQPFVCSYMSFVTISNDYIVIF